MITKIDFLILNWIQAVFRSDFLDFLIPKITMLGDAGFIWIIFSILMILSKKYRRGGIVLLVSLALGAIFGNLILKPVISRPRPCHINEDIILLIGTPRDFSFPSGHTLASVTSAYVITYINKKWGYIAIALAVLIAFSRLYLYVHFPTDIIGGAVIGMAVAYLTIKLFNKRKKL